MANQRTVPNPSACTRDGSERAIASSSARWPEWNDHGVMVDDWRSVASAEKWEGEGDEGALAWRSERSESEVRVERRTRAGV